MNFTDTKRLTNAGARKMMATAIAAASVSEGTARYSVGASAGIVLLSGDATPAAISEAADKAMYVRKKERRSGA